MWLDASDSGSVIVDGNNRVSSWNDLSGNGNDVTQSTQAMKPLWDENTKNGRAVLDFDGGDTLSIPSGVFSIPNGDNTIFVVSKSDTVTGKVITLTDSADIKYEFDYLDGTNPFQFQSNDSVLDLSVDSLGTPSDYTITTGKRTGTTQSIQLNIDTVKD